MNFGACVAIFQICDPIASNGSNAFPTALLIDFPAINASHINMSAIMSIIIVPNIPPVAERTDVLLFVSVAASAAFV